MPSWLFLDQAILKSYSCNSSELVRCHDFCHSHYKSIFKCHLVQLTKTHHRQSNIIMLITFGSQLYNYFVDNHLVPTAVEPHRYSSHNLKLHHNDNNSTPHLPTSISAIKPQTPSPSTTIDVIKK